MYLTIAHLDLIGLTSISNILRKLDTLMCYLLVDEFRLCTLRLQEYMLICVNLLFI